jgi:hypothetical protein
VLGVVREEVEKPNFGLGALGEVVASGSGYLRLMGWSLILRGIKGPSGVTHQGKSDVNVDFKIFVETRKWQRITVKSTSR